MRGDDNVLPNLGFLNSKVYLSNNLSRYGMQVGVLATGVGYIQQGRTDGTATAYSLLLNPNGGNVGIGTTSPAYKLDVSGTGRFTGNVTAPTFVGALSGTVSATTGNFSGTLRLTKDTPSGTTYNALAMEVYSSGGHPVGIGFHRGGYSQTILSHEGSGLIVRTSTISTGALAPITASSFIGKATSAGTSDLANTLTINSSASASWFDIL